MPFGLKNAGATYQRLVNHMFHPQIEWNVEVYIDDMLVKSLDEGKHLHDLQETFDTFRQYNMKLNPSKCAFKVSSRKFIGFMVSHRGIEENPNKIQAILDMKPHYSSFAESIRPGRGVVFILGSNSTYYKLSIDPGRRKGSEAYVLYKSSA